MMFNSIEEALDDLKQGKMVIVYDEAAEMEGDFVTLARKTTPETINFMSKYGRGLICMPVSPGIAKKLQLSPMVEEQAGSSNTAFTVTVDHVSTTTGTSAFDRAKTVSETVNPNAKPKDFQRPGHIFPLIAKENGVLERQGHTEAAVDLAILSEEPPACVICEIMNEDGGMASQVELRNLADYYDLKMITVGSIVENRKANVLTNQGGDSEFVPHP